MSCRGVLRPISATAKTAPKTISGCGSYLHQTFRSRILTPNPDAARISAATRVRKHPGRDLPQRILPGRAMTDSIIAKILSGIPPGRRTSGSSYKSKVDRAGEQLLVAAADRAVKEALSYRLYEQTWIRVGHPTPETPSDERMAILKRFKKTSRKNGHHKAWSQWGDAQATAQRLAEEIPRNSLEQFNWQRHPRLCGAGD